MLIILLPRQCDPQRMRARLGMFDNKSALWACLAFESVIEINLGFGRSLDDDLRRLRQRGLFCGVIRPQLAVCK